MTTQTLDRYREYDAWGWFYNQTMGPSYCAAQLPPLKQLLLSQIGKSTTLLDVCCGTGHLVQALVDQGYSVTGIDGSEQMLNYARENAPQADFELVDARSFSLDRQFDAAFSTSASLNHILDVSELEQVFRNVQAALKPEGLFLFDLNHHTQMQKWWRDRIAEGEIHADYAWSIQPTYDPHSRQGAFTVTMYRQLETHRTHWPKRWLYRLLRADFRRINRWRLQVLANFDRWEPTWQKSQATYDVCGYDIASVVEALRRSGFQSVVVSNLEGAPAVDENHSAYFICRK